MKTGSEDDSDVHVTPARLQGAVWNGLKAERSHTLPHVKRSPDGIMSLPGAHLWRDIFYAVREKSKLIKRLLRGKCYEAKNERSAGSSLCLHGSEGLNVNSAAIMHIHHLKLRGGAKHSGAGEIKHTLHQRRASLSH